MASFVRIKNWVLAAALCVLLGWRALVAASDLVREIGSFRPDRIERALTLPLEERIRDALVLPEGSLGASRDARTFGWEIHQLLARDTEPGAGVFLLFPEEPSSFRLYVKLSALLYPRVLVLVRDAGEHWVPTFDHPDAAEYVLDLGQQTSAVWRERAHPVRSTEGYELWRVSTP